VEFAPILQMQGSGRWNDVAEIMKDHARRLELAGAEGIMLCSNTMHTVAAQVGEAVGVPLLHVADAVGAAAAADGRGTVGLLGTKFTMEGTFYADRLKEEYGIEVLTPPKKERERINGIIYNQLAKDIVTDAAQEAVLSSVASLVQKGAQGIVVGCTELPLILKQKDVSVPLYDTLTLHIDAAVDFILG
jgi:aspartate racemase